MFSISKSRNEYSHSFISSSVILILMTFIFISFLPEISYSDRIWVSFISAKGGSKDGEMGAPPEINVLASDDNHTLVHVTIPGMWVDTVMGPDGQVYQTLEVPDYATTNDVGLPELPAIRGLLGIPDSAQVSMIPEVLATQILDNYYVWPHQRPIYPGEEWQFEKNEMFYNSNSWFPLNHNEVGEPGIFKYYTVDNVGYIPFSYNPYLRQLNVSYDYNIDVIYSNGGTIPEATMDEYMANLMRGLIWNFDALDPNIDNYAPVYYMIITPDEYYDDVCNFADWMRTIYPYTIDVVKLSEIGENQEPGDIKKYIYQYYLNVNKKLDYVLLIGDVDSIETFDIYDPQDMIYPSDYLYTLLTFNNEGDIEPDIYPEIAIGRFSFNKYIPGELFFQFYKEVSYYNQGVNNNVLMVTHKQDDNIFRFKLSSFDITGYTGYIQHPNFISCHGIDGATNNNVKEGINSGVSSVCYLGHGQIPFWENWNNSSPPNNNWENDEIEDLENINKLTVVFNYCCLNAYIRYQTNSLCEGWMLGGYDNRYISAVATLGHSKHENHLVGYYHFPFMNWVYRFIYGSDYNNPGVNKGLGWILNAANVKDYELFYDPLYKWSRHNCQSRILLGDPALRMRTSSGSENLISSDKKSNKNLSELKGVEIKINNPIYDNINLFIKTDKESNVNIDIYDISGRKLNRLYCGQLNIGENNIEINNIKLKSGVYILNIYSDSFNEIR